MSMSKLETALIGVVEVFEQFAGTDDDKKKLSSSEMSALINAQLSSAEFKSKLDPQDIKEALERMDKNHDGQVNFKEFNSCMSRLIEGYFNKKYGKDKGRDKGKGKC